MNNPVTKALLEHVDDPNLADFILDWDDFEGLILSIYRQQGRDQQDNSEFLLLRGRLLRAYPRWKLPLKPFLQHAKLDGQPLSTDPFDELTAVSDLGLFINSWQLIRLLPVAREILNMYLLSYQDAEDSTN